MKETIYTVVIKPMRATKSLISLYKPCFENMSRITLALNARQLVKSSGNLEKIKSIVNNKNNLRYVDDHNKEIYAILENNKEIYV